jgi:hypothetical protein
MTATKPDPQTIQKAVMLAGRAPSVHNSQPWHWVAGGAAQHLLANRERLVPTIDSSGRETIRSCGAALDHRVGRTPAEWHCIPAAPRLPVTEILEFRR